MFKIQVRAILDGLKLAMDFDFRQLKVECDIALIVKTILVGGVKNSRISKLRLIHYFLNCD